MNKPIKYYPEYYSVLFKNNTELPVIIEAWDNAHSTEMMSHFVICKCVNPFEKVSLYSLTGEWYINSGVYKLYNEKVWNEKGKGKYKDIMTLGTIGKFYHEPYVHGKSSWMNTDLFIITHDIFKNTVIFEEWMN